MDFVNVVWIKVYRFKTVFCKESLVTEFDTLDAADTIAVPECAYYSTDNIVETWAKTATSTDTCCYMFWIEVDVFTRTGLFKVVCFWSDCFSISSCTSA